MILPTYRILEEYFQEIIPKSLFSRNFQMLIEGFKHLNVYLLLAQKFSNFFISLSEVVEIFGNFLRIIYLKISPILNFYVV